jgi:hypothetical protein
VLAWLRSLAGGASPWFTIGRLLLWLAPVEGAPAPGRLRARGIIGQAHIWRQLLRATTEIVGAQQHHRDRQRHCRKQRDVRPAHARQHPEDALQLS